MHQPHSQRPKKLIEPQFPQTCCKHTRLPAASYRIQMHVDLRTVAMNVLVDDAVVLRDDASAPGGYRDAAAYSDG